MSVAFRRESDEEHKEPRFEIPLPVGPNLVTRRGLDHLHEKAAELESRVSAAPDESAAEAARRELRYWRTRIATAQLVPPPDGGEVAFGSRVGFRLNGAQRTVDIVGDDEADPAHDRIAFSAPIARAMMGAQPGDFADFGGKPDAIEILSVSLIP